MKKYCCATGTCDPACSTKQLTTKMCVRKAPDGTYRVTSNNNMNINGLTIKKFKSNCQNNELSKIDTPVPKLLNRFPKAVVNYTDDDNRPSTSSRAIIRKTTTMTSSVVPPKQINDNEQYVMSTVTMPIKYNKQNKSNSDEVLQDNDKLRKNQTLKITHQNKIMSRRNTLFVPKLQELAKEESYKLNTKPQNGTTIRRNSYFNSKLQEPTKNGCYTIPQSLLSSTEPLADTSSESISKQSLRSLESPPNGEDLFLIQKDPPRKQPSVPIMDPTQRRRKAALKPKRSFSEETKTFEHIEEHFNMPARPRQNIQLIESLARYRTIVKFILNHLDINQIDFNNDDYINLYKFNRG